MAERRNTDDRRESDQRRRLRRRRHTTNQRTAVIEVSGAVLRVVLLDRSGDGTPDKVRAVSHTWREEAVSLSSEKGLKELSAALCDVAEQHQLQQSDVQFVLGGEYCVTKAVRGSNEQVASELAEIAQRSRLYLMLGPGEKVTVTRSQPIDARHEYAMAAVCNLKTLNTLYAAATKAELQIVSIEPALVATSRAIGRLEDVPAEPCLLVHLDRSAVEVGICHEGRLLLDYRPGGRTDPKELVELVRTHLSRLQRHVGRQLQEAPPTLKRVYLCGEESAVEQAFPAFSACQQFEVESVAPVKIQATWEFAGGVKNTTTVPALGALLSSYLPPNERDAPNFMEYIVASTREPLKPILFRSALPIAAVLLVALGVFFVNYREQVQVDVLQEEAHSLAAPQARARQLQLDEARAKKKLKQVTHLANKMQAVPASKVIARIGYCLPSDVWLSRMSIDEMETIQLAGVSYLEAGVFDFVNWLEQAPGLEEVALRSTQPGHAENGPAINFDVELKLGDFNGPVKEVARNE